MSSPETSPKTTPKAVIEFPYGTAVFMVSAAADRGSAASLMMQGQCEPIAVATLLVKDGRVTDALWQTPFSGDTWQLRRPVLINLAESAAGALLREVSKR
ncbi:hypothetical protein [Natronoglycomyces albus]|uniref:Uncharacterized protein n=1 Tax=Natronoglycomyces albus TaxID=2811108 RepID=A0A895XR46_9ACTN|nr:hypothetical protein [Natronoglycomyces albus]QSB05993.1 hypothetical protein JQS30_03455 [Natronoglycomyces albus]